MATLLIASFNLKHLVNNQNENQNSISWIQIFCGLELMKKKVIVNTDVISYYFMSIYWMLFRSLSMSALVSDIPPFQIWRSTRNYFEKWQTLINCYSVSWWDFNATYLKKNTNWINKKSNYRTKCICNANKKNNKINKAPLFWVRCIDLYSPFSMLFSVWQNDFPALWESQRFSHISLSDWWETPQPVLLLTLKININLLCVHSRVSVASLRDARGTDLYSSQLGREIWDFMSDIPYRFRNCWFRWVWFP